MTKSARDFAVWAHGDQKYGERPYVVHLDAVADIVRSLDGLPDYAVTVAYLHDVVEDTDVGFADVEKWFGFVVRSCVVGLTDPEGKNRRERKARLHAYLAELNDCEAHRVTLSVKTADRLANVRASTNDANERLLAMYAKEHPEFRRAVFRAGPCDELWAELDGLVEATRRSGPAT
jgi:guanosine-3',5'-bis(diphosphate) 3'-pyrophosphohydrolase